MISELDPVLTKILGELNSSSITESDADNEFLEWWNDFQEHEQEEVLEILKQRAELILPNRNEIQECLPWNLMPNDEESSRMLSKCFPEVSGISFTRECLRWAAISKSTAITDGTIMGARTRAMLDFAEMMHLRHDPSAADEDIRQRIRDELYYMAREGHFIELSHGLYVPHLFAVSVTENKLHIISGFPFKRLQEIYPDLENNSDGFYIISKDKWNHEQVPLDQYIQGPDEVKLMSNSAAQYIKTRIDIAFSNDPGSEIPDIGNLITPGENTIPRGFLEGKMYHAQWKTTDGRSFFIERERYSPEYQSPMIWVSDSSEPIRNPKDVSWRSTSITPGTVKQIKIAYAKIQGQPFSLEKASNQIKSFETYRFSRILDSVGVDNETTRKFCEMNWLEVE